MPSYTILLMRQDRTDKRPFRIHLGIKTFWFLVIMAVGLPIAGFLISVGILAPAWLKLDFKSMQQSVEEAEHSLQPLQKQNAELASKKTQLEAQLKQVREEHAQAETEITMARTARAEASNRIADMEGELITLKKSLASYEKLLKPKLERELIECVDTNVTYANNQVSYKSNFMKTSKTASVPAVLQARVRVMAGDNAVAMEQSETGNNVINHTLEMARSQSLKGTINLPATQAAVATRILDIKIFDGNKPVGYCWKAF
jgi:septal ring factor EnvC (AmiA/AmiB activator)